MHAIMRTLVATACLVVSFAAAALEIPKEKQTKLGKYVDAREAAAVVKAERDKVVFVDVRTRGELQFVGWTPEIDGTVAFVEMSQFGEWDDKAARYKLEPNPVFSDSVGALLAKKGLGKDGKVLLMCRSGDRSARAVDALAGAGFTNVYSVIDGFEGDMSPDGRRSVNGWKNAGLPWAYKLDKAKVFQAPR